MDCSSFGCENIFLSNNQINVYKRSLDRVRPTCVVGILIVPKQSTGKTNKITITNDKGRLSQDDIERMVKEAERFKEEDERQRKKIDAKNSLENYSYSLKNTMQDDKVADKLDASDKASLTAKIDETISWIENNQSAEVEEFEARQKELEGIAMPIMTKLYQSGGAPGGMPDMGGMPGAGGPPPSGAGGAGGPHIEEVD